MTTVSTSLLATFVVLLASNCLAQPSTGTSVNLSDVRSRQKSQPSSEVNIGLGNGQEPWRVRVRPPAGGGSVPAGNRELADMVRELRNSKDPTDQTAGSSSSRGTTYVIIRDVEQRQAGSGNNQSMQVGNASDTPSSSDR